MIFSHDLETDLIQPGIAAPPHVCGSYANETGSYILSEAECVPWFRERLERGDRLVGLNYAFDLGVMCAADPSLVRPVFAHLEKKLIHDVGIREALIDIATGDILDSDDDEMGIRYGMRILSQRYFGEDVREEKKGADSWRRRYALLRGKPVEQWPWQARRYVLRDAAKPHEIYRLQEGRQNVHAEYWNVRAMWAFQLMSMWGLRTSRPRVTALEAEVEDEWLRTRRELEGAGIFRPDKKKGFVQDKKRTAELVRLAYGDATPITAPSPKFPKGQVATDRDTLVESGDPLLVRLGSAGKNDKRRSTYLPILKRGLDVPWNPQFNALVATGRASGDAQQFPTGQRSKGGIRECFDPRPGFVYCSVDYSGLELRTMSQIAIWKIGYSRMAEVLNRGDDPHTIVAAQLMNITADEALALKAAGDKRFKVFRGFGKIFNFGAGGGMGAGSITYNAREKDGVRFCVEAGEQTEAECRTGRKVQVRVKGGKLKAVCARCLELAKKFRAAWLEAWPEQRELFKRAGNETDGNRLVDVTIPGADIVRGRCGYSKVLNNPFQGIGGLIAKEWTWRVSLEMHTDEASPLWGSHLVLMVHDELLGELVIKQAPEAADRISAVAVEVGRRHLPDLAPSIEAPPAISMTMDKNMEPVRDSAGRLQLWTPKKAA